MGSHLLVSRIVQVLLNGVVNGLMISVLAVAFAIAYLPTKTFHLALGGIHAFIPFIVWQLLLSNFGWVPSLVAGALAAVLLSVGSELLNYQWLERRGSSSSILLISSLGLYIIYSQTAALIWGTDTKTLRTSFDRAFVASGLILTQSQLIEAVVGLVALLATGVFLKRTNLGLQFRAMADNPVEMILRGYDVWRVRQFAFAFSGLLCTASAVPLAIDYGFDPNSGLSTLLLAIVAVMIGGQTSFWGPIAGGMVLGVVRSEVSWVLSASWQLPVTFALLTVFLLFRPAGLVGQLGRLEARS